MILLAKIALGVTGTLALATVYTFHEGTIRVNVDEHHAGGSHVHVWVPAAVVPMAMRFVPDDRLREAEEHADEWVPVVRAAAQSLKEHPEAKFVEVQDGEEHVQIQTHEGKLLIDVVAPDENVHVACPISTIEDVVEQLSARSPHA
jgi:hypothetical protein